MALHGIDAELIMTVAEIDASAANARGITVLTLPELAERAGVSRRQAAKARLVLVEAGLQSLGEHPAKRGATYRMLHEPNEQALA